VRKCIPARCDLHSRARVGLLVSLTLDGREQIRLFSRLSNACVNFSPGAAACIFQMHFLSMETARARCFSTQTPRFWCIRTATHVRLRFPAHGCVVCVYMNRAITKNSVSAAKRCRLASCAAAGTGDRNWSWCLTPAIATRLRLMAFFIHMIAILLHLIREYFLITCVI
jgi:hypothetical protein